MRSARTYRETIEEPAELLCGNIHDLSRVLRPAEAMLLKALVPKTEAVAIPVQNLERITLAVAEDEKVPGEGVQGQEALNRHAQSVDPGPHVRNSRGEIDLGRGHPQHRDSSTDKSLVSVAASKSAGISIA